ncbi:MAG: tRNA cyclic N6-threonylcarbamoyladenosine(37) synthase TcdA [Firmicutes bacterium HGW-Firmicutes-14]|nr:MAG: tRNA cyclic N6-threonylcarbamoyladenosine(37) synthase TcdA [Firmicutes bacterium HGW-Firmicutes-14]
MLHRFSRTELIIGRQGLDKLKKSTVAVFGVGGVGSFAVESLARSGIGRLLLIDHDIVDLTNINRQIHALESTVGLPKVDLMKQRVLEINPDAEVEAIRAFYSPDNGEHLLAGNLDYIIDAIDNITGKIDLIIRARQKGIRIVSAMGAGNKLDPSSFEVADISETSVCPLARVLRRELKKAGIVTGVKVVYSREQSLTPLKIEGMAALPGKRTPGSVSFVPPVAGMILTGVVVRDILGISTQLT